jgi:hypothetical protein
MKTTRILQVATLGSLSLLVAPSFAASAAFSPSDAHTLCDGEKHEEVEKTDSKKTEKSDKKKDQKSDKKSPATT